MAKIHYKGRLMFFEKAQNEGFENKEITQTMCGYWLEKKEDKLTGDYIKTQTYDEAKVTCKLCLRKLQKK